MKKFKIFALLLVMIMVCAVVFVGCSAKTYDVTIVDAENGSITIEKAKFSSGDIAELSIVPNAGYKLKNGSLKFVGTDTGTKVAETILNGTSFAMPKGNVTVKAEFEKTVVIPAGQDYLVADGGATIYFGQYPQTVASALELSAMSTAADANGYYTSGTDRFVKVTAQTSAAKKQFYNFSTGAKIVNGTEYFFKIEPIRWDVITSADGNTLVLADAVLDSKAFLKEENFKPNRAMVGDTYNIRDGVAEKTYANNWKESDLRIWLNTEFMKSFNATQLTKIVETTLDNNNTSYYGENSYDGKKPVKNKYATSQVETSDNVFLLSAADINNTEKGFMPKRADYDPMKMAAATDFAKASGAWVHSNVKTIAMNKEKTLYQSMNGNATWWLRSSGEKSYLVSRIGGDGTSTTIPGMNVYKQMIGVRPAMNLSIKTV